MGKEKNTPKEVRPSTTRRGTDLPSRPNFSPNVASAVAPKKKGKVLSSSPLSKMSTSNENDLLCRSIDREVTPETSEITETSELPESAIVENVESELKILNIVMMNMKLLLRKKMHLLWLLWIRIMINWINLIAIKILLLMDIFLLLRK